MGTLTVDAVTADGAITALFDGYAATTRHGWTGGDSTFSIPMPEGAEYTFRDLARGPGDLGYVLASDGSIHVLDPATGAFVDEFPVIDAWEGPAQWQDPHPAIRVSGEIAYVTEPASNAVHAVDLTTGEIVATGELSVTPNELAVAAG